ncbi:uncharacterized protein LOC119275457 [Triticum dicoccoides]|uniref:uncharacterized protein LOC119275457 n=1 Tax=Triticum dicoccoides TaxID=85692 RepID=UPI00188E5253|nr:uncharacterized protein LOC119275457 [Triticum dicoccoides]
MNSGRRRGGHVGSSRTARARCRLRWQGHPLHRPPLRRDVLLGFHPLRQLIHRDLHRTWSLEMRKRTAAAATHALLLLIGQVFVDLQACLRAGLAGPIQHGTMCLLKLFVYQVSPHRLRPPRRRPRLRQPPLLHEVICFLQFGRGR